MRCEGQLEKGDGIASQSIEALKRSLIRDEIDESVVVLCRTLRLPSTPKVFGTQDDSTRPFNGPALQRFIISTRRPRIVVSDRTIRAPSVRRSCVTEPTILSVGLESKT